MDENEKRELYSPKDAYADKKGEGKMADAPKSEGFCDNPYGDPAASEGSAAMGKGQTEPWLSNEPINQPRGKGLAVASMIVGIVSLFFSCCCGMGLIPAIVSIVLAVVDMLKRKRACGYAVAGLVLGVLSFVLSLLLLVGSIILFSDPAFWEEFYAESGYAL